MVVLSVLLLPLAATASVLHERQFGGREVAKVAAVETLQPQFRKTAQRTLTKYGPYSLKGATIEAGGSGTDSTLRGQSFFQTLSKGLCNENGPCTVLAGKVGVQFVDGSKADPSTGIYIHHILTSDATKKQKPWLSSCGNPNSPVRSITALGGGTGFVGTGEDSADGLILYTSEDGIQNTGYHIGAKDSFFAWAQLVNYNKEPKQIYITYDLEWVPGTVGDDLNGALISVTQCGTTIKLSQTGPTNTTSGKFYFMEDGRILSARGHLHEGGVKMDMFINDKFTCSSDAVYDSKGAESGGHPHGTASAGDASIKTISSMTTCKDPIAVKKGDALSMVAEYDLKRYPLRKSAGGHDAGGVMGMWAISFAANKS